MGGNSFFYFLTLDLLKEKQRFAAIAAILAILVFLLSSTLFISASIKHTLNRALDAQPDFIVQSVKGGMLSPVAEGLTDKIASVYGVQKVTKRVFGRYFFDDGKSALIIGVDFLDEQSSRNIEQIVKNINLKEFLSQENMIIGQGVYDYFKNRYFPKSYNFLTPSGELKEIKIYKILSRESSLVSNDEIIMPIESAKEILGLKNSEVTDIALNVPNESERENIKDKLLSLAYSLRVVSKDDVKKLYENLYNYKGGLFMIMFILTAATLSLLLYLRYTLAVSAEKKEIAILRAIGWSIKDILKLKFFENLFLFLFAFITGASFAYIYVFIFNAPLLKNIFLGGENLKQFAQFEPVIDFSSLATVFILFGITFLASVLIPVWKISVTNPKEALV